MRVVVGLIGGLAWCAVAWLVGTFVGLGSERLGWLWMALVYAVGLALAVRIARARWPWLAGAVVVALAFGTSHWFTSPPTAERVADVMAGVEAPDGFREVDRTEGGNTWCLQGCPRIVVTYEAPGSLAAAEEDMGESLEEAGWSAEDGVWSKGLYRARLSGFEDQLTVSYSGRRF